MQVAVGFYTPLLHLSTETASTSLCTAILSLGDGLCQALVGDVAAGCVAFWADRRINCTTILSLGDFMTSALSLLPGKLDGELEVEAVLDLRPCFTVQLPT